jgi:DNA-binding transcriptional LysR family regulator
MDRQNIAFDWNLTRAFLVTAEEGSLSAAARSLGLTQPTLGRQVAALEERLGVTLFERLGRSLTLTQSGLELLDHVRAMGEAANNVSLTASGQSQSIAGSVCITATDITAMYFLPNVLKRLRQIAPEIDIEILASNEIRDLRRREADIAIRHARPEQPDLIARRLRDTSARFYAATEYLERTGRPSTLEDMSNVVFVGFEQSDRLIPRLSAMGLPLTKDNIIVTSECAAVTWEMVKQGLGIGAMVKYVADRTPGIERVFPEIAPIPVPVWLVTHRELHTSRRIRLVFDVLAEALG